MRRPVLLAAFAAALAFAAPAHAAGIWTPISSGTSDSIRAISYQSDAKLFFATSSGKIFQENADGSGSVQRLAAPGVSFNDIAFSPSGNVGLAVGANDAVYRSTDSGLTWNVVPAAGFKTYDDGFDTTTKQCTVIGDMPRTLVPFNGDFGGVSFKDDNTAYIVPSTGAVASVQKTTDGGATFTEVSRTATGCNVDANDDLTDVHAIAGSDSVYFISRDFGQVFSSSNGLTSPAALKNDHSVNCFTENPRFAIDDADASKIFASDRCDGDLSYQFSSDSGVTFADPTFADGVTPQGAADVAAKGGNAIYAGVSGGIYQSNGTTAVFRPADGSLATTNWKAVGMTSAANAVVGGDGGALVRTTSADQPPDTIAPAGTISGPATVPVGAPETYAANVTDNAGGSGVDTSSFAWSATGVPNVTGNPVSLTFPTAGTYIIAVTFKDKAGNVGTATYKVVAGSPVVNTPPPNSTFVPIGTKNPSATKTSKVGGGSIKLSGPKTCVPVGQTFSATLSFKKATKKKKGSLVKVSSVAFSIDGKTAKNDKKAPFSQKLSVTSDTPNSKHTLKARATIKVRHGKSPKKSISTTFQVCGA